jgi:sporulation protein YlmC with PRC-barrel domain
MSKVDYLMTGDDNFTETYSLDRILGALVVSKNGLRVGKVIEVRILPEKLLIEGVLVKRGFLKRPVYIGKNYFKEITQDALILNIDPAFLLKGRRVFSAEGESQGKVRDIVCKGDTNTLNKLIVKSSFLRMPSVVPAGSIEKIGESIFLSSDYHVDKKYIWQKS